MDFFAGLKDGCWEGESPEFLQREGGGMLEASHAHSGVLSECQKGVEGGEGLRL